MDIKNYTLRLVIRSDKEDFIYYSNIEPSDEPFSVTLGQGEIFPALESHLSEMTVGDIKEINLDCEEAYGHVDSQLIFTVSKTDIEDNECLVGQEILIPTTDSDDIVGIIEEVHEDNIQVNCNHPLAGHPVKIHLAVTDITETIS